MANIKLHQMIHCPYCIKVRNKLDELQIDYEVIEVVPDRNHPSRRELAEKSGVLTVPVLEVDGKFIGESQTIIDYLEQHFK